MLEELVATSISYAECLHKLGLRVCGGNYKHLQKNITKFQLSTEHMLHQASNQNREFKTFDELTRPDTIKKRLVKELGHVCQKCLNTTWLGQPICLELEHINGNNRDHSRGNVTLLCPNCHSQTPTWRNRKRV